MQRLRTLIQVTADAVRGLPQKYKTLALGATAGGITIGVLHIIAEAIITDWWNGTLVPWLSGSVYLPDWFVVLLGASVLASLFLLASRQTLKGENVALQKQLTNHDATVVEHAAKTARSRNDVLTAMLRREEGLLIAMIGAAVALYRGGVTVDALMIKLLDTAINSLIQIYGGRISRGLVLIPDPQDERWLICYASVGIDEQSRGRRHYIGPMEMKARGQRKTSKPTQQNSRGVAGMVFTSGKPKLVHVDRASKKADCADYIDYRGDRSSCPYQSFVAIPICDTAHDKHPLGVLCLDSPERDTFDEDVELGNVRPLVRDIFRLLLMRSQLMAATAAAPAENMLQIVPSEPAEQSHLSQQKASNE